MGETTNSKIKPVYFNLDDEDELELYEKACQMKNFSRWVKKQLNGNDKWNKKEEVKRVEKIDTNTNLGIIKNEELDSMMI